MHKTRLAMVTAAIVSALTLGALTSCAADKTSTQAPAEGEATSAEGADLQAKADDATDGSTKADDDTVRLTMEEAGVYMVQVGDGRAYRVMLMQ